MDFSNIDLDIMIPELDAKRIAMNMSYQNVADSCDVSQTTIIRIFKRQTEPTVAMLQKIACAVKYEPRREENILTGYTQEDYIRYLQRTIEIQKEEHAIEKGQQEAQYNRRHNEDKRALLFAIGVIAVLVIFVCGMFAYDFSHLDRGWIQQEMGYYSADKVSSVFLAVRDWFVSLST